eukprot:jgi/Chlat1/7986/Chrsp7S07774
MREPAALLVLLVLVAASWRVVDGQVDPANHYAFDGWGNNIGHPEWGAAKSEEIRDPVPAGYLDGISQMPGSDGSRPSPRAVSDRLSQQAVINPKRSARRSTDLLTYIGQFFDHDITHTGASGPNTGENEPIPVPRCDYYFDRACTGNATIAFQRSSFHDYSAEGDGLVGLKIKSLRSLMRAWFMGKNCRALLWTFDDMMRWESVCVFVFVCASFVCTRVSMCVQPTSVGGCRESSARANLLRTYHDGHVKSENGLLPRDLFGLVMADAAHIEPVMLAAGDVRGNVNGPTMVLHTIFMREHNRLATELKVNHPTWTEDQLYHEARKWNIAFLQMICFYEYLPALGMVIPEYTGYKPDVNPTVDLFFSTVAYRYGHSEVGGIIFRTDDAERECPEGHLLLRETFFAPMHTMTAGIEPIVRGLTVRVAMHVDAQFDSAIKDYLFGNPGTGAVDLVATNIQRGRDHGIPDYNTCRKAFGLKPVTSFAEITSDPFTQQALQDVYGSVDNLDPYIAGTAEDHVNDSNLGELYYTSLKDQYTRIRDGDRYYFESRENGLFTDDELTVIRSTRLRDVILRNTDIQYLPRNLFVRQDQTTLCTDSSGNSTGGDTGNSATFLNGAYRLWWRIVGDTITINATAHGTGWVGFGLAGPSGGMVGADITIGYISASDGSVVVNDYWADNYATPVLDTVRGGQNSVMALSGSTADGYTTISFARKLDTGDPYDRVIATSGPVDIIYAYNPTVTTLTYHGSANRSPGQVTFGANTTAPAPTSSAPSPPTDGYTGHLGKADGFQLAWKLVTTDTIEFQMTSPGTGWLGVGFDPDDTAMSNADMYIGYVDASGAHISDYWSTSTVTPTLDTSIGGTSDVLSYSGTQTSAGTTIVFMRKLVTGDAKDRDIASKLTKVIYAWHATDDTLLYHGTSNRGMYTTNLLANTSYEAPAPAPAPSSPTENSAHKRMLVAHGVIMSVAWIVISVISVFIARFGRGWKHWVFAHQALQTVVLMMGVTGVVLGYTATSRHFYTTHGIASVFIVTATLPQYLFGWLAVRHEKTTIHWRRLHRAVGYFLLGMAVMQTWSGMAEMKAQGRITGAFLAWVIASIVAFQFSTDIVAKQEVHEMFVKYLEHGGTAVDDTGYNGGPGEGVEQQNIEQVQAARDDAASLPASEHTGDRTPQRSFTQIPGPALWNGNMQQQVVSSRTNSTSSQRSVVTRSAQLSPIDSGTAGDAADWITEYSTNPNTPTRDYLLRLPSNGSSQQEGHHLDEQQQSGIVAGVISKTRNWLRRVSRAGSSRQQAMLLSSPAGSQSHKSRSFKYAATAAYAVAIMPPEKNQKRNSKPEVSSRNSSIIVPGTGKGSWSESNAAGHIDAGINGGNNTETAPSQPQPHQLDMPSTMLPMSARGGVVPVGASNGSESHGNSPRRGSGRGPSIGVVSPQVLADTIAAGYVVSPGGAQPPMSMMAQLQSPRRSHRDSIAVGLMSPPLQSMNMNGGPDHPSVRDQHAAGNSMMMYPKTPLSPTGQGGGGRRGSAPPRQSMAFPSARHMGTAPGMGSLGMLLQQQQAPQGIIMPLQQDPSSTHTSTSPPHAGGSQMLTRRKSISLRVATSPEHLQPPHLLQQRQLMATRPSLKAQVLCVAEAGGYRARGVDGNAGQGGATVHPHCKGEWRERRAWGPGVDDADESAATTAAASAAAGVASESCGGTVRNVAQPAHAAAATTAIAAR